MLKTNAVKRDSGCRDQFLRAIAECFARLSYGFGVCLSVCLSVTLLNCAKTVQARIKKSRDKILCPCVRGFLLNESAKEGYPIKKWLFYRY